MKKDSCGELYPSFSLRKQLQSKKRNVSIISFFYPRDYHPIMQEPRIYLNFCLRCGGIIDDAKSIARGYGPHCWKIVKPKDIKPYVQEVPFIDTGTTDYLERCYPELTAWEDSF